MRTRSLIFAAALFVAQAASAQSAQNVAEVHRAAEIGWELYEHDQAAWLATDAMLADIHDPQGEGLHGWITERTPDGVQVLFVKTEGGGSVAAYRALYRDGALRAHGRIHQALSDLEARLYRARTVAMATALPQQCAASYNSVTLPRTTPGPDGADVDVYVMPALSTMDEVPFGGHYRLAVDAAAGAVRDVHRFTNACITMKLERDAEALVITQLIGDTPTEIHVFESLTARKPVYVMSRSGAWAVEGRNIRYVDGPPAN